MPGSLNLTATSPPQSFTEVLTVQQVKDHLVLPARSPADDGEDFLIQTFISAAREQAEIFQGRDLVPKSYDLSLDCFPCNCIELRDPLVSVDLVQYRDSDGTTHTLTADTDYIVDTAKHPGIVLPAYGQSWPSFTAWPSSAVLIRFTSGFASTNPFWADAGARVKNGMLLLISAWFNGRLPFEIGASAIQEYPFTVTTCLSYGALIRAR